MQYLKMLPYQVREAIEKNTPVVFPLGVVEYHAEHLPLGVDCFTCINAIERVEKRHPEIVVLSLLAIIDIPPRSTTAVFVSFAPAGSVTLSIM